MFDFYTEFYGFVSFDIDFGKYKIIFKWWYLISTVK